MMRAEVGDQLVGPGRTVVHGEIVGVVTAVHGEDGGPPFTIRWYEDGRATKINPDPERFWIRSQLDVHEVGTAMQGSRSVAWRNVA
jgi:hypothetical protein